MSDKTASEWSVEWWKHRHELSYFPAMETHLNWKVYDEMFPWFLDNAEMRPDDTALEIGAGYGEWMVPMSRHVKSITGVDLHQSLVDKAAEILVDIPHAKMLLSDGTTLPFKDNLFSFVYSISVFQHIPRSIVAGYFRETNRVLQPGGRLLFHFRWADGVGEYSSDIVADHTGDFSVGWTAEEAMEAAKAVGFLSARTIVWNDCLILTARSGKVAS